MRILDRVSTQLTTLHKVLLDDLFKLATTVYTEVGFVIQCLQITWVFSLDFGVAFIWVLKVIFVFFGFCFTPFSDSIKVRIKAQRVLSSCIDVFDYFARTLIPPTLSKLQNSPDVSHEEFKVSEMCGTMHVHLWTSPIEESKNGWQGWAQSVSAQLWCIRFRVRSPDLTSLFRLLSFQCSLSSFKYP